jgi:hypothetical protein
MAKERKIKCDCGTVLSVKKTIIAGITTEAMICGTCGFTTLTKDQAKKVLDIKKLQEIMGKERKIIKIGNSLGITLPERIREIGVAVGKKVRIEAVDKKRFMVILR